MAKDGHLWRDDLNDQICWRFSNYKYTARNTLSKFERDLAYLKPYYMHLLPDGDPKKAKAPPGRSIEDLYWRFPFDDEKIKTMAEWLERMNKELDQLISSLDEVTSMALNPFFPISNWASAIVT
jgi:hypothetical protein